METHLKNPRSRLVHKTLEAPEKVDARFVNYDVQVEDSESGRDYIQYMVRLNIIQNL